MRIIYIIFTLVFILFSAFQYNDPDPEVWIPLYGFAALMSFLMAIGKLKNITLPVIGMLVYVVTAIIDWPDTFQGMENSMTIMKPEIEKAREASGMLISAGVMLFYIIIIIKKNNKKVRS